MQLSVEAKLWPYSFAVSDDFPSSDQRGSVNGSLLVYDRYVNPLVCKYLDTYSMLM